MRSGISLSQQRYQKQIISASEIMHLNDLEAFIRLPGDFPVTKIKLSYKQREKIAESIVPIYPEIGQATF